MTNMTDSQKMRALKAEIVEQMKTITQPLKDDIAALKAWQANQQKEQQGLKRTVIRFAKGLLKLVGSDDE